MPILRSNSRRFTRTIDHSFMQSPSRRPTVSERIDLVLPTNRPTRMTPAVGR